jgi:hypothetical protein
MDLRDQWRLVMHQKRKNLWRRRYEISGELGEWRLADNNEKSNPVADDRFQFIGLVAYAGIMGDGDPISCTDNVQPLFIAACRLEMIAMPLDVQPRRLEDIRKPIPQITIREKDGQAARS